MARAEKPGKLNDEAVKGLDKPAKGNRIRYDGGEGAIRGFGARVTASGAKSFVLNYTVAGRERRYTIGGYPAWSVAAARNEAKRLRQEIDQGQDPLAERVDAREAPTVAKLCERYLAEHAVKKRTEADDKSMVDRFLRRLRTRKVAEITFTDVDGLHREVTKTAGPYAANRLVSLLSKMFALSIKWQMRPDNPAKGVDRNPEEPRNRYLSAPELLRLTEALAAHSNQVAANVIRLLLLTGARRGEVLGATWNQFDLDAGRLDETKRPYQVKKRTSRSAVGAGAAAARRNAGCGRPASQRKRVGTITLSVPRQKRRRADDGDQKKLGVAVQGRRYPGCQNPRSPAQLRIVARQRRPVAANNRRAPRSYPAGHHCAVCAPVR